MGRKEDEAEIDASKLIYPAMQVADIFELDVDVALGGMDQRKAHMLARDISSKLGWKKVIAIHTPLLSGLQGGRERMEIVDVKMSKSNPEASILIHDSPEEIKRKIQKAYCPEKVVEDNPVLEICKYILFKGETTLKISRPEKFGGDLDLANYNELEDVFKSGSLHPLDLKNAVSEGLSNTLEPVRNYFKINPGNYEKLKQFSITR
jgi:tyrosyl-tRNA synthetase